MSKIRIKNFGPIRGGLKENDGWLDICKVTIFIGDQGSGKSTLAKTISVLTWLEKSINRGDTNKDMSFAEFTYFFRNQRIYNYFTKDTYIEYIGEAYHIKYDKNEHYPIVTPVKGGRYIVPKIMYVPSERNLLSTVAGVFNINGLPENLFTFAEELRRAQLELGVDQIKLPVQNYSYSFNKHSNTSTVTGLNHQVDLLEASSGLQSLIPLYLVSRSISMMIKDDSDKKLSLAQTFRMNDEIANLVNDKKKNNKEKQEGLQTIISKYYSKCFINIVEEPEQNLFPRSQWELLKSLLEFNNSTKGNKLIITTHSPFLINYLSIAIQAGYLIQKIEAESLRNRMESIMPISSMIDSEDVEIYQLDNQGVINRLLKIEGIPSDLNYLNRLLAEGNQLFDQLLEIEQDL